MPLAEQLAYSAAVREAARQRLRLRRGTGGLACVVTLAPWFGILGTVIGIVNSFPGICGEKSSIFAATTALLSYAVVPTALGLGLAIAAFWLRDSLLDCSEQLEIEMDVAVADLRAVLAWMR